MSIPYSGKSRLTDLASPPRGVHRIPGNAIFRVIRGAGELHSNSVSIHLHSLLPAPWCNFLPLRIPQNNRRMSLKRIALPLIFRQSAAGLPIAEVRVTRSGIRRAEHRACARHANAVTARILKKSHGRSRFEDGSPRPDRMERTKLPR